MSSRSLVPTSTASAPGWSLNRSGLVQRQCACGQHTASGGECEDCKKKQVSLLRHSAGPAGQSAIPPVVHQVVGSSGRPLSAGARDFMEPRFGHDFSGVRVHTDDHASESARAVNAFAYTVGDHIAFQTGHYDPASSRGRRLLAHELTHVVQNRRHDTQFHRSSKEVSDPGDASEREAARVSDGIVSGGPGEVAQGSSAVLHRDIGDVAKDIGIGAAIAGGAGLIGLGIAALAGAFRSCSGSHTIPNDVYDAIGTAWGQSGHGGETVAEHGGRMVKDSAGKNAIRTGTGGSGSISLPDEQSGDTTTGTFHTHPYSKSEGSTIGVSFSGGDITNFVAGGQGTVKYVGAGSCIFGLVTRDQSKQDECKKKDINKTWNDTFNNASGSFQEKVDAAVKASIDGCGICYYKACRPDESSAIPKTASLA